jgi:hypothetical protein
MKQSFMYRLAYGTMQRAHNVGGDALVKVAAKRLADACGIGHNKTYDAAFFQGLGRGVTDTLKMERKK